MARADVSASVDAQGLPNANQVPPLNIAPRMTLFLFSSFFMRVYTQLQPYHIPAAFARALAPGTPGHHLVKTSTGGVRTDGKVTIPSCCFMPLQPRFSHSSPPHHRRCTFSRPPAG